MFRIGDGLVAHVSYQKEAGNQQGKQRTHRLPIPDESVSQEQAVCKIPVTITAVIVS
jgi:hypothetical protein